MTRPDDSPIEYTIDGADRIIAVNAAWARFAVANGGAALLPPAILGQSLWGFLSESTTRQLYQRLLERVRSTGAVVEFPLRCDSPTARRFLRIRLTPGAGRSVQFEVHTRRVEVRPPVTLLEPDRPVTADLVRMCAWCKRIDTGSSTWVEVEQAMQSLGLVDRDPLPGITHGICGDCLSRIEAMLEPSSPESAASP